MTSRRALMALGASASLALLPAMSAAQIAVIGSTVEEHDAMPGERYQGTIIVRSQSTTPQTVRIYQTDYRFFADGTSHFDEPGTTPRSNARWIQPSAASVVIPPLGETVVEYTVVVPAIDSLRGTYWSALMIEGAPSPPPNTAGGQVAIGVMVRHAVQLVTHLATPGSRRIAFLNQTRSTDSAGHRIVELEVQNTGERAYRPLMWAELYDAAGMLRGRREQQRGLIYPGTSVKQRFAFDALPPGIYKVIVFADTGADSVFATQYKVEY